MPGKPGLLTEEGCDMKMNEVTKASGVLVITLTGPDGKVKEQVERNLIVNVGLAYLISRAVGTAKDVMSHMALGEGQTTPAAGDTALEDQLDTRVGLDSTTIAGSNLEQVVYVATFAAGQSTGPVTEAGIFNAATSGDMLCRTTFPVVNKQADDTLAISWTVTLSAS